MVPRLLLPLALVLCVARPALAEWHFTPLIGATFGGNTTLFDNELAADRTRKHFGGSVAVLGDGIVGVESIFVWTPAFFERGLGLFQKSHTFALVGNVVVTTPRRWTEYGLRPYVSGGYGLMRAYALERAPTANEPAILGVDTNFAAWNVGGGAVGFLSNRTGLRFDFRYYHSLPKEQQVPPISLLGPPSLRYMTFSVGVVLRR